LLLFLTRFSPAVLAPRSNAGVYMSDLKCILDPKVNETTFKSFKEEILGLWEPFCAINRGIFVLTDNSSESKNQTYSCGTLPETWDMDDIGELVGAEPKKALYALDQYFQAVFNSSDTKIADTCDFHGLAQLVCNVTRPGVQDIERGKPAINGTTDPVHPWHSTPWVDLLYTRGELTPAPLRSVNIGGLFVLEPWITPDFHGKENLWSDDIKDQYDFSQEAGAAATLKEHWETWYTQADFDNMAEMGLNSIRLPVGWWYFAEDAGLNKEPYLVPTQKISDPNHPITKIIEYANEAKLMVTIDLHGAPSSQNGLDNSGQRSLDEQVENWGDTWLYNQTALQDTTAILVSITKYINALNARGVQNVIMLELVNEPWVFGDMSKVRDWYVDAATAIRAVNATLPLLIHDAFRHEEWSWLLHRFPFKNVFMDTHLYHAFNINDFASSDADCDKSKMIAHENLACRYGSMLRYKSCVSLPAYTGEWSLATDQCMPYLQGSTTHANQFQDVGQCNNIEARVNDEWWNNHTKSFAMRQISRFEQELGWAFWTYKLGKTVDPKKGEGDIRNQVWCFHCAVENGWIDTDYPTNYCDTQPTNPFTC
jgi:glucan 1,3-beta-glucosidase